MPRTWAHTNIHRLRAGERDVISVKCGRSKIRYEERVVLVNAVFWVNERARLECVKSGVRNVHAWVVGDEISEPVGFDLGSYTWKRALYDPWKSPTFVNASTLEPVHTAEAVVMIGKVVWYR